MKLPSTYTTARILLVCCLVLICGLAIWYTFSPEHDAYEHERILKELRSREGHEFRSYMTEHMHAIFEASGIDGLIDPTQRALDEGRIGMFVCHSLLHDIGHYAGYPDNFPDIKSYVTERNLDFCGSGFLHGVEGELANAPYPKNREKLYEFCRLILPYEPYYNACYHGAGHAFMENERDTHTALAQCDELILDEYTDATACYRGVFSQNVIYMHESGAGPEDLLEYCQNLEPDLHRDCAHELNGLEMPADASREEMNELVLLCTDARYSEVIQRGCVSSVAGVITDRLLERGGVIESMPAIHEAPQELQRAYIAGTAGAFVKTAPYAEDISLHTFCTSFDDIRLREECTSRVSR